MSHLARMIGYIRRANLEFSLFCATLLSWPLWLPSILALSIVCISLRRFDAMMGILTIQTSVDAQATKTMQNHLRDADEARRQKDEQRDRMMAEQIEALTAMVVELRGLQDNVLGMMSAAERRDRLSAKRDKLMLTALEARNDLTEYLRKEGALRDAERQTARRSKSNRAAHGRPNRRKS